MRILTIDSSLGSELAVIETRPDDGVLRTDVLVHLAQADSRHHAESLGPMLQAALGDDAAAAHPLDAVVAATGPAPFTGLRAGLVTARTVGRARSLPVYGVPSLDAVARAALDEIAGRDPGARDLTVLVATDARRKEVYAARYRANGPDDVKRLDELTVCRPDDALGLGPADAVAGSGAALFPALAQGRPAVAPVSGHVLAQVRVAMARLGRGEELPTEPLYLRHADVHTAAGRKRAS